jgi:hypothetical protein
VEFYAVKFFHNDTWPEGQRNIAPAPPFIYYNPGVGKSNLRQQLVGGHLSTAGHSEKA